MKYNSSHIGESYITKQGYTALIIDSGTKPNYCIIDLDGQTLEVQYSNVKRGNIKNLYHPNVFGKGYIGIGKYTSGSSRNKDKVYNLWTGVLRRLYSPESLVKYPTYKNVEIDESWLNYQVFAKWVHTESNYKDGWDIDKDILSDTNNKIYSPETCVFIPRKLNSFMSIDYATNNSGTVGAYLKTENNKWSACIRVDGKNKHLGYFDNKEEASEAYNKARDIQASRMKELYKDILPKKVIDKIR